MLHVAVNAISLSDTFFKKLPRTHSAVAFSKTKPAALGFDLDVKAKISELKLNTTRVSNFFIGTRVVSYSESLALQGFPLFINNPDAS